MEFYQQVHLKEKKGTKVGKSQLTEPMKLVKPRNSTDIKITKGMYPVFPKYVPRTPI